MGAGCKPSKSSSGVFPPARLHLLKVSQLNQTLPLAEEQMFKRTVDTDIQTTVASCWLGLSSHSSAWWGLVLSVT